MFSHQQKQRVAAPEPQAVAKQGATEKQKMGNAPNYMPMNLSYPGLERVHDQPPIYVCKDFLSHQECDELIATAGPLLQRSKTHAVAGSEATKGRTSLTCHLAKHTKPCPLLLKKVQLLTNKPYGHMELPQVARYTDSQRYVEHYDGVDPHTDAGRAFCQNGGQRIATVLMYLNDVPGGGSTFFRRINLEVRPKKGSAVIFFPGFMDGELDTDALHAGMPAHDVKWVSQIWLRHSFREDGQPSSPVPLEEQAPSATFAATRAACALHCMRTGCALHAHCMRAACTLHARCIHAASTQHRAACAPPLHCACTVSTLRLCRRSTGRCTRASTRATACRATTCTRQ